MTWTWRSTRSRPRSGSCGGDLVNVLCAMSGGVDSSVAAALLIEAGHDVVGVTMKLWGGDSDRGCCSVADVDDARRVARQLGIDHLVFNFADDFDTHVVDPYVAAHARGRTPNPCIECNRYLKFDRLIGRADLLGFDAVATGHHCRVVRDGDRYRLARGADRAKDQSYVVHMLDQATLARTLFPVGAMTKAQVRERASALGLRTAAKPDSQDVCFISASGGRSAFLGSRIALRPGRLVDTEGRVLGQVDAVQLVTIGQRRGMNLGGDGPRRFAIDVDVDAATVTIGGPDELMVTSHELESLVWVDGPVDGALVVQCAAHGEPKAASLQSTSLRFAEPQRRIAPGQSVVFYDRSDIYVLGGAIVR